MSARSKMALRSTRTDIEQLSAEDYNSILRIYFSSKLEIIPIIWSLHESEKNDSMQIFVFYIQNIHWKLRSTVGVRKLTAVFTYNV